MPNSCLREEYHSSIRVLSVPGTSMEVSELQIIATEGSTQQIALY